MEFTGYVMNCNEEKIVIKFYDTVLCKKIRRLRKELINIEELIYPIIEKILTEYNF